MEKNRPELYAFVGLLFPELDNKTPEKKHQRARVSFQDVKRGLNAP